MQHYFTHTDTDLSSLMLTKSRDTWESQNSVKDNKNNDCISWKFHCLIRKVIWEVHLSEKKKKKTTSTCRVVHNFSSSWQRFRNRYCHSK